MTTSVICEGTSNTQVKAISNSIEEKVRKTQNEKPWHVEGQDNAEWVLLDYVNIVAHIFLPNTREFYDLEGMWGDAEITVLEENY
ncbi:MAG: ribosome silencing factor [Owenweeksia sp.]|nr:ribosome silencing factor [Owenweeksia sp.]